MSSKRPFSTAAILLTLGSVAVCVAAIWFAWTLAGAIGAAYMTFGVILMVIGSAIAVWFRIYYDKRHVGPGAAPRPRPTDPR